LTGLIRPATGLLQITFGNGDGKSTSVGYGALLQNTTNAGGYFVVKTNAGSLILQP
jgi:ATP:corrinoid adenosyltransferase